MYVMPIVHRQLQDYEHTGKYPKTDGKFFSSKAL